MLVFTGDGVQCVVNDTSDSLQLQTSESSSDHSQEDKLVDKVAIINPASLRAFSLSARTRAQKLAGLYNFTRIRRVL